MSNDSPLETANKKQKVLQCFYCGNSTLMNLVGEHKYNWDEGQGYYGYFNYKMFSCPVCGKVTFFQQYWDCTMFLDDERTFTYEEILYPINKFSEKNIPVKVKDAYEAALKTQNIDSSICLIALRKTLEIICKEKKANGKDLWNKIKDLSTKGILPPALIDASTITKNYGNIGAHGEDLDISPIELELVTNFVQYIIDYLYILPAKIDEAQKKLANTKTDKYLIPDEKSNEVL